MKTKGAIMLVAGTCIGSGMIALPMVLAKVGLIPSLLLMLVIWFFMYYTSLINLELNLQADQGLTLGELGRRFSGRTAEWVGSLSLQILSYSLLTVFIYGGSSIMQQLLQSKLSIDAEFNATATCFSSAAIAILLLPLRIVDYCNRFLFMSLLLVVFVLIVGLVFSVEWESLPLFSSQYADLSAWTALLPVVFTSFGFQVIFHNLINYCNKNAEQLKRAFFWGSLIPCLIYILWTCSILSVVHNKSPEFYHEMVQGSAGVGRLIEVLSDVANWQSVQLLVWFISLLAILTSIIGVGIGLSESLKKSIATTIRNSFLCRLVSSIATIVPSYLAVLYIPNAFISILGFAGMILSVIAIILPIYLFWKIKPVKINYVELKSNWLIWSSLLIAGAVIVCELKNML